jgi:hypothetical protein
MQSVQADKEAIVVGVDNKSVTLKLYVAKEIAERKERGEEKEEGIQRVLNT